MSYFGHVVTCKRDTLHTLPPPTILGLDIASETAL